MSGEIPKQDPKIEIEFLLAQVDSTTTNLSAHETVQNIWDERALVDGTNLQISLSIKNAGSRKYALLHRYDDQDPEFEIWEDYNLTTEQFGFAKLRKDNLLSSHTARDEIRLPDRPFIDDDRATVANLLRLYKEAGKEAEPKPERFQRLKEMGRKALEALAMFSPRKY